MDSRNGVKSFVSSSRSQIMKSGAGDAQSNRGETSIPNPSNVHMIHDVKVTRLSKNNNNQSKELHGAISKTKPVVQTSQNLIHGVAAPPHSYDVWNIRDPPNNGSMTKTTSKAHALPHTRMSHTIAGQCSKIEPGEDDNQPHSGCILKFAKNDQPVLSRSQEHRSEQDTVQSANNCCAVDSKDAQQTIVNGPNWETMFDNGPLKFTITVDAQEYEVEMEPTGKEDPDLECRMCKPLFFSPDEKSQHERAHHTDQKRAEETIVFNAMLFHALQSTSTD